MNDRQANIAAILSAAIAVRVKEDGMSVRDALDAVCGAGTFARLADDVWEAAQQKAA